MTGTATRATRVTRLSIRNLRIIADAELAPDPLFNVVIGPNASGKTTLLEALYLLGRGRALRGRGLARLLRSNTDSLQVTARLGDPHGHSLPVGISKDRDGTRIRVGGKSARSALELAATLPLQVIHPDIHHLLQAGAPLRRQFLDRGLFHVEPRFLACWRRYRRALKQRNAALKRGEAPFAWDGELAEAGERLAEMRSTYLMHLQRPWREFARHLLGRDDVALVYRAGWSAGSRLHDAFREGRESDRRQGYTQRGPHRDDFQPWLGGRPAREWLSRGEQKLLLCALQLAQAEIRAGSECDPGIILIDDLPAELDAIHRRKLLEALARLGLQTWITSTESGFATEMAALGDSVKTFHVEHGRIAPGV